MDHIPQMKHLCEGIELLKGKTRLSLLGSLSEVAYTRSAISSKRVDCITMFGWQAAKAAVEAEGIYVGGWDLRNVFWAKRLDGHHGQFPFESVLVLDRDS